MRRSLAYLLMFLLVLQSTWAAAAGVCGHEPAAAASHFGHHVDLQTADQAHPAANDPAAPALPHLDCIGCQALCAALVDVVAVLPLTHAASDAATPYRRSITQGVPERLLRPPHTHLA